MIIANDKGIIKDRTALDTFLVNLLLGGYTTHQEVIEDAYRYLPLHMRDADLYLLPGAYKAGAIAMMNAAGGIVDLGFSRTGSAYGITNGEFVNYSDNQPVLDEFNYMRYVHGYLIEDVKDYVIVRGTTFSVTNVANLTVTNNTGIPSLINPLNFKELNDASAVSHSFRINKRNGGVSNLHQAFIKQGYFLRFNGSKDSIFSGNFSSPYVASSHRKGLKPINSSWYSDPTTARYLSYKDWDYGTIHNISGNAGSSGYSWNTLSIIIGGNGVTYVGNGVDNYDIIPMIYNINYIPRGLTLSQIEDELPKKFVSSDTPISNDIISTITLSNDSIIHIKTAKGVQEFFLPAGPFNVNDYVVNDKLICLAVKYD